MKVRENLVSCEIFLNKCNVATIEMINRQSKRKVEAMKKTTQYNQFFVIMVPSNKRKATQRRGNARAFQLVLQNSKVKGTLDEKSIGGLRFIPTLLRKHISVVGEICHQWGLAEPPQIFRH